ncbi:FeoB-associated Cys-rich membrane protein [Anaeromicropila populeti]|uniref:Virus attachment protein p12 family protein n=1 Tax=Anaeromicropila populeti TaxID=37658 RepID=A0A1I6IPE4_9FIRM|nr:FeoB-associated Cys-rich membrane protein [Anaeromicropila populeti]SFR68521.1 Virus attachment protein p12 family protein [Anaeromicropila populeti]
MVDFLVVAIILFCVGLIVYRGVKNKKAGINTGCGCGCSSCDKNCGKNI